MFNNRAFTFASRHDEDTSIRFILNHIGDFRDAMYDLEESWDHESAEEAADDFGYQYEVIKENLNILRAKDVEGADGMSEEKLSSLRTMRKDLLNGLRERYVDVLREAVEKAEDEDWNEKFDLDFDWMAEEMEEIEAKE